MPVHPSSMSCTVIKTTGVLKTAIATSVTVYASCTPLPNHETNCPKQLSMTVPSPKGSNQPPVAFQVPETNQQSNGQVTYKLRLPNKLG